MSTSSVTIYRCPRCHQICSERIALIEHWRKAPCSNDYDSRSREHLLHQLWHTPEVFVVDRTILLKNQITQLEAEIRLLKSKQAIT